MRSIYRALIALDVLYCVLALFEDRLPGWKMFEEVEPKGALIDNQGQTIDTAAYLPRGAHVVDVGQAAEIAIFICDRDPSHAPYILDDRTHGKRRAIRSSGKGCVIDAL